MHLTIKVTTAKVLLLVGVKERRTKLLLMIFLLYDAETSFIELKDSHQIVFDISFNKKTKTTLLQLQKEEMIEKSSDDKPMYKLTEKGFQTLALVFPFVRYLKDKWDGKWRILSYEIPEKKRDLRDRLRREVAGWGLGPWHRSFWITPHPIIESLKVLLNGKEEKEFIQAFEAEHIFGEREILIEKVWKKSELERQYRDVFKKWHVTLSKDQDKLFKLKSVVSDYIAILKNDPGLPPDILGQNWIGFEGFQIFREIRNILLS